MLGGNRRSRQRPVVVAEGVIVVVGLRYGPIVSTDRRPQPTSQPRERRCDAAADRPSYRLARYLPVWPLTRPANRATLPDNVGLSVGRLISAAAAAQRERRRADGWTTTTSTVTPAWLISDVTSCQQTLLRRSNRPTPGQRSASVDKRSTACRL